MYENNVVFATRHTKKRMKKLLKKRQSGAVSLSREDDDFENFLLATRMRKCFYSETHNILGNTYGMCVLQVVHSCFANVRFIVKLVFSSRPNNVEKLCRY